MERLDTSVDVNFFFFLSTMRNQGDKNGAVSYECKENRLISIPFFSLQSSYMISI